MAKMRSNCDSHTLMVGVWTSIHIWRTVWQYLPELYQASTPQKWGPTCTERHVHDCLWQLHSELKITQMSINRMVKINHGIYKQWDTWQWNEFLLQETMMTITDIMCEKSQINPHIHTVWFHFYEVQNRQLIHGGNSEEWLPIGGQVLTGRQQRACWMPIMLLSLDLGSSYMSTYICKIHPAVHLRLVHFAVYMLYINKKMFLRKSTYLN